MIRGPWDRKCSKWWLNSEAICEHQGWKAQKQRWEDYQLTCMARAGAFRWMNIYVAWIDSGESMSPEWGIWISDTAPIFRDLNASLRLWKRFPALLNWGHPTLICCSKVGAGIHYYAPLNFLPWWLLKSMWFVQLLNPKALGLFLHTLCREAVRKSLYS